ncbi:hypothetical protein J6590_071817 [Homalodisca vitripennis]|nr:hypothetical protein J6590_071817 [Homalodisca vitripennis]
MMICGVLGISDSPGAAPPPGTRKVCFHCPSNLSGVICFINAKGMAAVDVYLQVCEVYRRKIMSDGMAREWFSGEKDMEFKRIDAADCVKPINDWIVGGFLNPANMKKWLEGVITKTLNKISNTLDDCQLKLVKSGPAMTLKVTFNSPPRKEISIDLVPVIEFPGKMWPPIPEKPKKLLNQGHGKPAISITGQEVLRRQRCQSHCCHMQGKL